MNWFAKVWNCCFGPEETPAPPPPLPPVVEAFLSMVGELDWRPHGFDYHFETDDSWIERHEVTFSISGEPTRYDLYKTEECREFSQRLTTAISNEDLQLILEFLRRPPYGRMHNLDKEGWDMCAAELLEIFVEQRADEVLPILASELKHPGIRGTILRCFMPTPAATPYLLSWVEQLPELADEDAELLIDCLRDSIDETSDQRQLDLIDKALTQVREQVNVSNPKIKRALNEAEAKLLNKKAGKSEALPE